MRNPCVIHVPCKIMHANMQNTIEKYQTAIKPSTVILDVETVETY